MGMRQYKEMVKRWESEEPKECKIIMRSFDEWHELGYFIEKGTKAVNGLFAETEVYKHPSLAKA